MKNTALLAISLCLLSHAGFGQKKLLERIFSNEKDTTRRSSFMPIPVLGYAQETGFEFGAGAIYSFYVDKLDTNNRSSNFFSTASYSTKKTYYIKLTGDTWSKNNKIHLMGEIRFKNTPINFYGIGNNTLQTNEDKLVQSQIKLTFDVEKMVAKNTYTGISIAFENDKTNAQMPGGIFSTDNTIFDKDGGSVIFIGASQSYDTRNSNNYPTKGFFGRITYQYAPPLFGGSSFTGSQIKVNVRNFWPLSSKITFGTQGFYHTVQSSNTSFYLLPQLGNDAIMRGYYSGRYRDENLIAAQAEVRYRFIERLGIVAFFGGGKVFANSEANLKNFKPNYGIGGRYFFDPAKGLSVRLDYGIGEKRANEKRQSGFYVSFAEAF